MYSPCEAQCICIMLSLFLNDDFSFSKLFLLPTTPFSIFFEKEAQKLSAISNMFINKELMSLVLDKSNQKLIQYFQ